MTTPLIESVRLNKINIIKILLSYGADPEIKEAWGEETAVSVAEKRGLKEIMALLNQRADSK
jgi:ankyrin repeat protein